ncbi:hypothetical protein JCM1841_001083 [Sporobolomyces salmonicolor]
MQALLAPSAPASASLTLDNLASHTQHQGLAPRRTVQIYLQGIAQVNGEYDLAPPRFDEFGPLEATSLHPHQLDSGERTRQRGTDDGEETALVLHDSLKEKDVKGLKGDWRTDDGPLKKKPSLVAAMRPRLSSNPNNSPPIASTSNLCLRQADPHASGSSSILIPRLPQRAGRKASSSVQEGENKENAAKRMKDRKGKGKAAELRDEIPVVAKKADKGKGKLRAEPEDDEEAEELEERLQARKERRRKKAFIRKDYTQTAAATGAAAAAKLKASKKRRHDDDDDLEAGSDMDDVAATKKGQKKDKRSAEHSSHRRLQNLQRPKGIGEARLTLKPPKELGIFNKGKASMRTKVGKQLPDLAFSEMNFLNSTRPAPPASCTSSSSDDLPPPPILAKQPKKPSPGGPKTYGTKSNSHRRRAAAELNLDSSSRSSMDGDAPILVPMPKPVVKKQSTSSKVHPAKKKPRLVFSHVEVPPPRVSSSVGSSGDAFRLPDSLDMITPSLRPNHFARRPITMDLVSQPSAHSAESLARRRTSRRAVEARAQDGMEVQQSYLVPSMSTRQPHAPFQNRVPPSEHESMQYFDAGLPDAAPPSLLAVAPPPPAPAFSTLRSYTAAEAPFESASVSMGTDSIGRLLQQYAPSEVASPFVEPAISQYVQPGPFGYTHLAQAVQNDGLLDQSEGTPAFDAPAFDEPAAEGQPSSEFRAHGGWAESPSSSEEGRHMQQSARFVNCGVDSDSTPSFLHPPSEHFVATATNQGGPSLPRGENIVEVDGWMGGMHGEGQVDNDEAAFRDAMRRQWPRTRC